MSLFQPPSTDRQFETRNIRRLPHKRHHSQPSSSSSLSSPPPSLPSSSRPSSVLSSRPSTLLTVPDLDHLDLDATSEWSGSSLPSSLLSLPSFSSSSVATTREAIPKKPPHRRKFVDRCLLVRTFHTPCGHITQLALHEEPCSKMTDEGYSGIVPESSAATAASECGGGEIMDVHLAMRKRLCDHCAHSAAVIAEGKKNSSSSSSSRLGKWFGKAGKSEGGMMTESSSSGGGGDPGGGDGGDSRWVLSNAEIAATGNAWMKDVQMQRLRIEESRLRRAAREKMKNRVGT